MTAILKTSVVQNASSSTANITLDASGGVSIGDGVIAAPSTMSLQSNGSTTALYIDTSQNVGIGTTSPNYQMQLYKTGAVANYLQVTSGATGAGSGNGTLFGVDASGNGIVTVQGAVNYITSVAGAERMRIDSSGNLLVGTTTHIGTAYITTLAAGISIGASATAGNYRQIYWDAPSSNFYFYNGTNQGYLNSAGSWTNASDARLKNSIVDIKYGLEDVIKLQPRSYRMNDLEGNYIGFVAQELQQVIPEVVSGDPEKQLGVDYGSLTALLTKAIQELSAKVDAQAAEITALKAKVGA